MKKLCTVFTLVFSTFLLSTVQADVLLNPVGDSYLDRGDTSANGSETEFYVKLSSIYVSSTDRIGLLRYDISTVTSIGSASLNFTFSIASSASDFNVYGIPNGFTDEAFDESTIHDGNDSLTDDGGFYLNEAVVTNLGSFSILGTADEVANFSSAGLTSFLQADTNDIASFVIARTNADSGSTQYIYSKEHASGTPVQLSIAIPEPSTLSFMLLGAVAFGWGAIRRCFRNPGSRDLL